MFRQIRLLGSFVVFIAVLTCWPASEAAADDEYFNVIEKLHVKLLKTYNKQIRPVLNHTQVLSVETAFTPVSFDYDDLNARFSAQGFFKMQWTDPRLKWSPSDYDGLQNIHVPSDKLWTPDLEVYNNPGLLSKERSFAATEAVIMYDGTVIFVPLANLVSVCVPNPKSYPYDSVTCGIKIGSWTHSSLKMNLYATNNETELNLKEMASRKTSQWNLLQTKLAFDYKIYECCPEPYQSMMISFNLQRSSSASYAIITPAIGLMILTLASLFIPPMVSSRVTVGVMNMVLLCGFMLYIHSTVPSGETGEPLIVSFFNGSLILVIISIVLSVTSLRLTQSSRSTPALIEKCLNSRLGAILSGIASPKDNCNLSPSKDAEKKMQDQQPWINFCLALDRFVFVAYVVAYVVFVKCYLIA